MSCMPSLPILPWSYFNVLLTQADGLKAKVQQLESELRTVKKRSLLLSSTRDASQVVIVVKEASILETVWESRGLGPDCGCSIL